MQGRHLMNHYENIYLLWMQSIKTNVGNHYVSTRHLQVQYITGIRLGLQFWLRFRCANSKSA